MASFSTNEGSWLPSIGDMKKESTRLAEQAILDHAASMNNGVIPVCLLCSRQIMNGKAAEKVTSGPHQGYYHETCWKQYNYKQGHTMIL